MERLQEALSKVQKEAAQYAESDPTKVEAMRESCSSVLLPWTLMPSECARLWEKSLRANGLRRGLAPSCIHARLTF